MFPAVPSTGGAGGCLHRWRGCFSPSPHQSPLCFTALRWGSFSHLALNSIRCHSPHHPAARHRCSSSIQVRGATGQGWHRFCTAWIGFCWGCRAANSQPSPAAYVQWISIVLPIPRPTGNYQDVAQRLCSRLMLACAWCHLPWWAGRVGAGRGSCGGLWTPSAGNAA